MAVVSTCRSRRFHTHIVTCKQQGQIAWVLKTTSHLDENDQKVIFNRQARGDAHIRRQERWKGWPRHHIFAHSRSWCKRDFSAQYQPDPALYHSSGATPNPHTRSTMITDSIDDASMCIGGGNGGGRPHAKGDWKGGRNLIFLTFVPRSARVRALTYLSPAIPSAPPIRARNSLIHDPIRNTRFNKQEWAETWLPHCAWMVALRRER